MDIRELIAAVHRTFDYVIDLYVLHGDEYSDLTFHDLVQVPNTITDRQPPSAQKSTLDSAFRLVEERGNEEARGAFEDLHRILNTIRGGPIEREEIPLWLQFFLSGPRLENRRLMIFDVRGFPVEAVRSMPEVSERLEINYENREPVYSPRSPVPTFVVEDPFVDEMYWTVIPGAEKFLNFTPSQPAGTVTQVFMPKEYWGDRALAMKDSARDNTIAMRLVLEDLGFYKTSAVFNQDVTFYNIKNGNANYDMKGVGYRVVTLPKDTWVRVLEPIPNPSPGKPQFTFNRRLVMKPEIAGKALKNLLFMADMLKHIGLAMNSWDNVMVNLETGELSLGETDRPVLLNANLFARALSPSSLSELVALRAQDEPKTRIPYFAATMYHLKMKDQSLYWADSRLKEIMERLQAIQDRFATNAVEATRHEADKQKRIVAHVMVELDVLAGFMSNVKFSDALTYHRDKVVRIIENYAGILGFDGLVPFSTIALISIIENEGPEIWFQKADEHILRLFRQLLNQPQLGPTERLIAADKYWVNNFERKRGGGGGAAPQTPPDISMGGLMTGGFGGTSVGQAAPANPVYEEIEAFEEITSAEDEEIVAAEDQEITGDDAEYLDENTDIALFGALEAFGMAYDPAFSAMLH